MRIVFLIIALVIALIAVSAATVFVNSEIQQNGTLQGKISIGPICPVERLPPDPNCQPTLQTYLAYSFNVYKASAFGDPGILEKVASFHGDAEGNYSIQLPAGSYIIKQESGLRKISETAVIKSRQATILNFDIDTGIR